MLGKEVGYNVGFLGSSLTCFGGQVHLKVEAVMCEHGGGAGGPVIATLWPWGWAGGPGSLQCGVDMVV